MYIESHCLTYYTYLRQGTASTKYKYIHIYKSTTFACRRQTEEIMYLLFKTSRKTFGASKGFRWRAESRQKWHSNQFIVPRLWDAPIISTRFSFIEILLRPRIATAKLL